jgi:hypothetical protein
LSRRPLSAALLAVVLSAVVASSALADPVPLGGSPLNVFVDELGQLQAFRTDRTEHPGIFFDSDSQTGDAGFFLAFPTGVGNNVALENQVFGFSGGAIRSGMTPYTTGTHGAVTNNGGTLSQETTYSAAGLVAVKQTTTYVNGAQQFRIHWDVTNNSLGPIRFKALSAADFYFDGSDRGTGVYTPGPPQFIGGTNADTGNSGGFEEVIVDPPTATSTPRWDRYEALEYGNAATQIWGKVKAAATTTPTFANAVLGEQADNAGGVEWDRYLDAGNAVPNGQTRSFELVARSAVPAPLILTPSNAGAPQGVPINITATATNSEGVPYAGRTLRYTITGVNPSSGSVTLGPAGTGVITDPGANAGPDTIVAYVDLNNNGVRADPEPQASALATFIDNIRPTCTVKITGDRPGGSGGAGKPLTIDVNCGESATVTVATSLQPPAARRAVASAKKKKKAKRIKLKTRTVTVVPGRATAVKLKIPKSVARKYAGKTLTATMTVTAKDSAGNVKKTTVKRKVKLAKLKKTRSRRR